MTSPLHLFGFLAYFFLVTLAKTPLPKEQMRPKLLGPMMPFLSFPDPSIIYHKGNWYAFATSSYHSTVKIQVATSPDYANWTVLANENGTQYDAMPDLAPWIDQERFETWAPDVIMLDDGSFVMYYSANKARDGRHCISAAKSKEITGPYIPLEDILVCPDDSGGAFDAVGFKDWEIKGDWDLPEEEENQDTRGVGCWSKMHWECGNSYAASMWSEGGFGGKRYIIYKIQNAQQKKKGTRTPLTLHEVCPKDGVTLIGEPVMLMENNGDADQHSIEAPSLFKTPRGKYVLFFSSGNTVMPSYTLSYAVSDGLFGPYKRKGNLLQTGDYGLNAPGGMDINFDGKRMLFHEMGQPIGEPFDHLRVMHAAKVDIDDESGEVRLDSL